MATVEVAEVYWLSGADDWWVVWRGGRYHLVPASAGGWEQRRVYRGQLCFLRPVPGETARAALQLVGVPADV